jgi:AcrR family transcriptional regulator
MSETAKPYDSPLRRKQQAATREAILEAVALLVEEGGLDSLSFAAVATRAGVQERTVYRHFASKAALLEAFWSWINEQAGIPGFPTAEADLVALPPVSFQGFDRRAAMMAALIFSQAGRDFRLRVNDDRQRAYRAVLDQRLAGLDPAMATRICAVVQLLHGATAWATMRDYWGLDGKAAGETVAWAIDRLLSAVATGDIPFPAEPE